jgi:hypothetical protein
LQPQALPQPTVGFSAPFMQPTLHALAPQVTSALWQALFPLHPT